MTTIHTANLARRVAGQILVAMAEESMDFANVAARLSTSDLKVEAHEVRSLIFSLAAGKDCLMSNVAQLARAVHREVRADLHSTRDKPSTLTTDEDVISLGHKLGAHFSHDLTEVFVEGMGLIPVEQWLAMVTGDKTR